MKSISLHVYKVKWKHTANTYIACKSTSKDEIMKMVYASNERCDDIADIEEMKFPAFDDRESSSIKFVEAFLQIDIF